jgi:hypothetical protein
MGQEKARRCCGLRKESKDGWAGAKKNEMGWENERQVGCTGRRKYKRKKSLGRLLGQNWLEK